MKNIYYIKDIDILSILYLYLFVLKDHSEVYYIRCSKKSNFLINFISRSTNKKFKQFIKKNIITKNGSLLHLTHSKTNLLAQKFANQIKEKICFADFFSENFKKKYSIMLIRHAISIDIYDIIYFKIHCSNIKKNNNQKYIICANTNFLDERLKKEVETQKINLAYVPTMRNIILFQLLKLFRNLMKNSINLFFKRIITLKKLNAEKVDNNKKIAINYTFDLSSVNSNSWWLDKLDMPKKNIIYYFSKIGSKIRVSDDIAEKIYKKGYTLQILDKQLNNTKKNKIKSENILISFRDSISIFKNICVIIFNFNNFYLFKWNFYQWLKLIFQVEYFKIYLIKNNIHIILDHSDSQIDLVSIAAQLAGAKKIGYQRSEIVIPRSKLIRTNNYHFIWGNLAYYVSSIYRNNFTQFITVGNLSHSALNKQKEIEIGNSLIKNKIEKKDKILVSIFDRTSGYINDHPIIDHIDFYNKIIEFCEKNKSIILLVKPKDVIKEEVLNQKNIKQRINELIKKKKIIYF